MQQDTLTRFFSSFLQSPAPPVLMLDYDGTLAPFHIDRHSAVPYPQVVPLLDRMLQSGGTRIVVITGRPVREVQALLQPLTGFEAWGAHGLEHLLPEGLLQPASIPAEVEALLEQAGQWLRKASLIQHSEIKTGGIAVHWRGLDPASTATLRQRTLEGWSQLATHSGLRLLEFDGGLELRAARPNKGDAVEAVLQDVLPETPVAFLGDDLTDEDAFRILNGRGLSILVRTEHRQTHADAWLKPPQELIQFLESWLRAIDGWQER